MMWKTKVILAFWTVLLVNQAWAITPKLPLGSPDAVVGGTFYFALPDEPSNINPITQLDRYSEYFLDFVMDKIMTRNLDTYEWEPGIAEKYEISKDGKSFTFTIRSGAKFHDGSPVTAEDVKFSFDGIRDPAYNAAHRWSYYENIEKAEVVAPNKVRFTAKNKYFDNFNQVCDIRVIPKKIYENAAEGLKLTRTVTGSGPYKLAKYEQGKRIVVERNADWWGFKEPLRKGQWNFNTIVFRFVKEPVIAAEMLKKGEIDYYEFKPEGFEKNATGPEWGKTVFKEKAENKDVKNVAFIVLNQENELFKDKRVRKALTMLMNREMMIEKFRYGLSLPSKGPWYQQSDYADASVKALPFDPKGALGLLNESGWKDSNNDGILDKVVGGERRDFRFTLFYANATYEKYWTLYKEELKRAGIELELKLLEWNAMVKAIDEKKFEALTLGWGGGFVDLDPKQAWHSASAVKGGSNYGGYKNPKADKLIDEAREELDKTKRLQKLKQVYRLIAEDVPYIFLFDEKYSLYGHTARMQMPRKTFNYDVGYSYWFVKE